jgi:hypothetical protein
MHKELTKYYVIKLRFSLYQDSLTTQENASSYFMEDHSLFSPSCSLPLTLLGLSCFFGLTLLSPSCSFPMIMTVLFFMVKFCFNAHLLNLSFKLSNLTKEDYKMIPESSPCCWLPLVLLLQKILKY